MSDRVYVGRKLGEFESSPAFEPVTKVILWYDDESSYAAGDDGGRVLELTCPWATQAMAENILASVSGFVYRPFSGTGALLDPAAELGDAVTVNGVYSMLATMDTNFDALCLSDISAPADEEVDHEYPYQSPQGRELRRKVSLEQKYYGTKISRREGLVIEKTDGDSVEARVVLNAEKLAFYDGSGQEQLYFDPAEGVYKFRGALNVNDNFIVNPNGDLTAKGNINLAGNINMSGGVITWGQNGPVKYQFSSVGLTGPWHDTMQTNDKYRRDSLDGGTTWGAGYQFVGKDGQNGQDGSPATVPKYITETVIAKGVIEAPRINANVFSVYPKYSADYTGSFNIFGQQMSDQYHMFTINYQGFSDPTYPYVELYSPDGANMYLCANTSSGGVPSGILTIGTLNGKGKTYHTTEFYGDVDFSNANVSGATFVLA
ncbi:hypothetical protein [Pseudoflavonifractor phocaeensis]|uniref:hypothetical protein n=1 Tax=Pseudoflavonifractor phocaeensis TaxID=1870988 RepID=UPI00210C83FC|nr:hypothetical protein [Pseudoflavonifractor phocaeensis]MCQ4864675.1 hypothetical protein [Pseudoflavonifractor phocaeensis]